MPSSRPQIDISATKTQVKRKTSHDWKSPTRESQARARFFKQHQVASQKTDITILEKIVNLVTQIHIRKIGNGSTKDQMDVGEAISKLQEEIKATPITDQESYFQSLKPKFEQNLFAKAVLDDFLYFYQNNLHFFTQGDYHKFTLTYTPEDYQAYIMENHIALDIAPSAVNEWVSASYSSDALLFGSPSNSESFQHDIPYYHATPPTTVKGVFVYIHGLFDSHESMRLLLDKALAEGYEVYAFDHRSHGLHKSTAKVSTNDFRIDFRKVLEAIRVQHPNVPFHVGGHSLGGAICALEANFLKHLGVDSITLLAGALVSSVPRLLLDKLPATHRNMPPEVRELQLQSPLFGGASPEIKDSLRLVLLAYKALEKVLPDPSINWVLLQGKRDSAVSYQELEKIMEHLVAESKNTAHIHAEIFPELDHGLHISPADGKRVLDILFKALNKITDELTAASAASLAI